MMQQLIILNLVITFLLLIILLSNKHNRYTKNLWKIFKTRDLQLSEYEELIVQLCDAIQWMSKKYVGALIVIEKTYNLNKFVKLGCSLNTQLSSEFLINIFSNKHSALHDGGVIVRGLNIISVSSYFPIAAHKMLTTYGARHRAALGITEQTDSIALVVSETNGAVSVVENGKLQKIDLNDSTLLSSKLFTILDFYIK